MMEKTFESIVVGPVQGVEGCLKAIDLTEELLRQLGQTEVWEFSHAELGDDQVKVVYKKAKPASKSS